MPTEHRRKSGQIPAFGDWENTGELPITQYFECARQAGLPRCTCPSGECPALPPANFNNANDFGFWAGGADLYAAAFDRPPPRKVGFEKPPPRRIYSAPQHKPRGLNKGCSNDKEQRKQVQVRYLMHHPRNHQQYCYPKQSDKPAYVVPRQQPSTFTAKPVDEDLYKVPAELLDNSKRKKVLGFLRRCMVPPCAE